MQSEAVRRGLIIFVKNPVIGRVKTRLAKSLGDREALRIYHLLLKHTRIVSAEVHATKYVFYSDEINHNDEWSLSAFTKRLQIGEDLGQRMYTAFNEILEHHEKVIIIGSDCLGITAHIIDRAFGYLDFVDAVIGPSLDGGYYLLGVKKADKRLFRDISWSSEHVLYETMEKINLLGWSHHSLEALPDIDTGDDWIRYGRYFNG